MDIQVFVRAFSIDVVVLVGDVVVINAKMKFLLERLFHT